MMLSFVLIGCSMLLMALIPSYSAIGMAAPVLAIIARLVQGFSVGGEIGSNTAFLVEAAAPERRGFIASFQGATQAAAVLVGSLLGFGLNATLPAGLASVYSWRIALLLGAAVVPYGLWLRQDLPETLQLSAPTPTTGSAPTSYMRIVALGIAVLGSVTIAAWVSVYAVTFAQNSLHMSAQAGFAAQLMSAALSIPTLMLCGLLSDRIGRKPVYVLGNLILLVSVVPLFAWITTARSDFALIVGMGLLGITKSFTLGPFTAGLNEVLPRHVRAMVFGTVYSFAIAVFGGSTQLVITWLIHISGSVMAPAWYLMVAVAIGQVALMLFPETAPIHSDVAKGTLQQRA
ncbi:MAG: MFS transporter, partial [Alphaproteobacteria bacterium]|nr:MFS transporter [Alphaproteobacteria bacterium]